MSLTCADQARVSKQIKLLIAHEIQSHFLPNQVWAVLISGDSIFCFRRYGLCRCFRWSDRPTFSCAASSVWTSFKIDERLAVALRLGSGLSRPRSEPCDFGKGELEDIKDRSFPGPARFRCAVTGLCGYCQL